MIKKICTICGNEYEVENYRTNQSKFCSRKCYWKSMKGVKKPEREKRIELICPQCNKPFITRIKPPNRRKFCSQKCWFDSESHHRSGDKIHNWNGGQRTVNGYVYLLKKDHPYTTKQGYVMRSRLTVEKYLNRYLDPKEVIHHINEIKDDDKIENLYLFPSKSAHRFYHTSLDNPNPNCRKLSKVEKITKSNINKTV